MNILTKTQRKQLLRSREDDAQVLSEKQRERLIGADLSWRGIGERVFQVREISAFGAGAVWDIRRLKDVHKLYVSIANPEKPGYLHPGYEQVAIDSKDLEDRVNALSLVEFQCFLPSTQNIGLDGTTTTVEFRRGFAEVKICWWHGGPDEWNQFTELIRGMIAYFKRLPNVGF